MPGSVRVPVFFVEICRNIELAEVVGYRLNDFKKRNLRNSSGWAQAGPARKLESMDFVISWGGWVQACVFLIMTYKM